MKPIAAATLGLCALACDPKGEGSASFESSPFEVQSVLSYQGPRNNVGVDFYGVAARCGELPQCYFRAASLVLRKLDGLTDLRPDTGTYDVVVEFSSPEAGVAKREARIADYLVIDQPPRPLRGPSTESGIPRCRHDAERFAEGGTVTVSTDSWGVTGSIDAQGWKGTFAARSCP